MSTIKTLGSWKKSTFEQLTGILLSPCGKSGKGNTVYRVLQSTMESSPFAQLSCWSKAAVDSSKAVVSLIEVTAEDGSSWQSLYIDEMKEQL